MFRSPGATAFHLGPIAINWYGIFIGLSILAAYLYISKEAARRGMHQKLFDDMAFWLIISGIIGARIYYVLFNWSYYAAFPKEIVQVWNGGLAIHGALIGGAMVFFIYMRRHKLSWSAYLDVLLPGVLLAQAIGRWGNFFNNEAFGRPTELPWKLFIPEQFRPAEFSGFSYFYPTFLYESLWNLAGFFLLVVISSKMYRNSSAHRPGFVVCGYLMWYSLGRFFIESLRTDSLYLGPLRMAQIVSVMLFFAGAVGLFFLKKKSTPSMQ